MPSKYFKISSEIRSLIHEALSPVNRERANELYAMTVDYMSPHQWIGVSNVGFGNRPGYVSYQTQGWDDDDPKGKMQQMKVGRFLRMFKLEEKLSDAEVELVVNAVKGKMAADTEGSFELVTGEDIRRFYYEEHYEDSPCVALAHSCMKYRGCGRLLDIYVKNDVAMLVFLNEDRKVRGRAIVWRNVATPKGRSIVLMDRIYASDGLTPAFMEFAKEQGWYYKAQQSHDAMDKLMSPKNKYTKVVKMNLVVELNTDHDKFPYLDTFRYGVDGYNTNFKDEGISIYNYGNIVGTRSMRSDERVAVVGRENLVYQHDAQFSRWNGDLIHENDTTFCAPIDSYVHRDDAVEIGSNYYPADCPNLDEIKAKWEAEQKEREEARKKREAERRAIRSRAASIDTISEWLSSELPREMYTLRSSRRSTLSNGGYFTIDTASADDWQRGSYMTLIEDDSDAPQNNPENEEHSST